MAEKETSFPYEAGDAEKKRNFYAQSLRPEKPKPPTEFLADESAEVGEPGDLGGGYNSLADGSLKPSDIDPNLGPDWKLTDQQRQAGFEGIEKTRKTLTNPSQTEESD